MATSRHERTHTRLIEHALDLFEAQGFEQTTVAQIAAAAEVTEMTFFRHFSSKELVVLNDPYDPAIADGVAAQPADLPALVRAVRGVRRALNGLPEADVERVRRRVRIIAGSAALRASSAGVNAATEARIGDQLIADGAPALVARAAAAAVLAALTAALFEWARDERLTLPAAIDGALRTLEGDDG
ncbi:TetR/AcrR family transcriptional regulator [Phytoactinopolyspora limicola]|uniref:TetR/AcrR family transcriptional regulator n=1 Tax=Phytoactinopolyspora limicola TaxID=2715536 RepID=UPI00140DC422|nr:TetR/AcrR family transcriptional regulator [Phytoactinopolyspora limicola]